MSDTNQDWKDAVHSLSLELERIRGDSNTKDQELKSYASEKAQTSRNQAIGVLGFVALLSGLGLFGAIGPIVERAVNDSAIGTAAQQAEEARKRAVGASEDAVELVGEMEGVFTEFLNKLEEGNGSILNDFEIAFQNKIRSIDGKIDTLEAGGKAVVEQYKSALESSFSDVEIALRLANQKLERINGLLAATDIEPRLSALESGMETIENFEVRVAQSGRICPSGRKWTYCRFNCGSAWSKGAYQYLVLDGWNDVQRTKLEFEFDPFGNNVRKRIQRLKPNEFRLIIRETNKQNVAVKANAQDICVNWKATGVRKILDE